MSRYSLQLTDSAKKHAESYLHETAQGQKECVHKLKQWLQTNEEMQDNFLQDETILVAFLRTCKYDLEKVKKKIINYSKVKENLPQIFSQRDPNNPRMQELLKMGIFVPLRVFHNDMLLIIVRVGVYDPNDYTMDEILKVSFMVLDICCKICPQVQVSGAYAIYDLKGTTLSHAKSLTFHLIKHIVGAWENYYCRPKMLHFINAPMYINATLNIFKMFMSQKLKERLLVSSTDNLLPTIDRSVLPKEYDGTDGNLQQHIDYWVQEVANSKHLLTAEESEAIN